MGFENESFLDLLDKEVTEKDVRNRVKSYEDEVNECDDLLNKKTQVARKEAFRRFKKMNKILRAEHREYGKNKYENIPYNTDKRRYKDAIEDIIGHMPNTNSYENLSSNLYDISSYFDYHFIVN